MRITGGTLVGRHIHVPKGIIRPAMDRMRESVFAILGDLSGKSFLDLFSGSGIIALEAASRGANPIELVEMDKKKYSTLIENVSMSPIRIKCRFIAAELYVKRIVQSFDYIFCDPPFPYQYKWELIAAISTSALIKNDSIIVMHYPKEEITHNIPLNLLLIDQREYGRSIVDFWRVVNPEGENYEHKRNI